MQLFETILLDVISAVTLDNINENGGSRSSLPRDKTTQVNQQKELKHLSSASIQPGRPSFLRKSSAWDNAFFTSAGKEKQERVNSLPVSSSKTPIRSSTKSKRFENPSSSTEIHHSSNNSPLSTTTSSTNRAHSDSNHRLNMTIGPTRNLWSSPSRCTGAVDSVPRENSQPSGLCMPSPKFGFFDEQENEVNELSKYLELIDLNDGTETQLKQRKSFPHMRTPLVEKRSVYNRSVALMRSNMVKDKESSNLISSKGTDKENN
ncbi:hypothetical protein RND71_030877 [Anisodus tanguticus]|uniref:Uncharacterized protein n=1 Tax=Anisodus tanguticus TaxID=243964 RepID=A0AAE1V7R9_9SOLA|nr:hypothetical protein RND71_030877 [Anisodus tanguticus]